MAGEVVSVGEDVRKWKAGDRVCANFATGHLHGPPTRDSIRTGLGGQTHGVLTEFRTFADNCLVSIPGHLSYEEASTLPCAALTAYNALHGPVPIKAGEHVLVLGTGDVSLHAIQFAVACGAIVIATSASDENLKVVGTVGAKHLINYNTHPNWEEEVLKFTNGEGVDHVIEVGSQALPKSIASVRPGGQVHLIGFTSNQSNDTGSLLNAIQVAVTLRGIQIGSVAQFFDMNKLIAAHPEIIGSIAKEARDVDSIVLSAVQNAVTLRGVQIGSVAQFIDMNKLISAHPESTRPLIDRVFPFEQAKDAYNYLALQAHVGRVIIKVASD
ncbi:hypothetical protein C0991_000576 [Blastosporella zonata]|nr:hypothetical protein C0991_000576 [Blastosporella zonata]